MTQYREYYRERQICASYNDNRDYDDDDIGELLPS